MTDKLHSHGRGGAGNIGGDGNAAYIDGDIVREGTPANAGLHGRGGAGNIGAPSPHGSPRVEPQSEDVIPESATRPADGHENFHTGRGGAGNEHKEKYGGHSSPQRQQSHDSLLEKAKHAIGKGHKDHKDSGLKNETTAP